MHEADPRTAQPAHPSVPEVFVGESRMAKLMRTFDWKGSPVGQPFGWPVTLRSAVTLMLGSRFPMFIAWGNELTFLYNDA